MLQKSSFSILLAGLSLCLFAATLQAQTPQDGFSVSTARAEVNGLLQDEQIDFIRAIQTNLDINGDGFGEFVTLSATLDNHIRFYQAEATGRFFRVAAHSLDNFRSSNLSGYTMAVGNIDADADLEMLVAYRIGGGATPERRIFDINPTTLTLTPHPALEPWATNTNNGGKGGGGTVPDQEVVEYAILGDTDADGNLEFAVLSATNTSCLPSAYAACQLTIYEWANFQWEAVAGTNVVNSSTALDEMAVGDVDGDGQVEVVIANHNENAVAGGLTVYSLNLGIEAPTLRLMPDGHDDATSALRSASGIRDMLVADADGNGYPDIIISYHTSNDASRSGVAVFSASNAADTPTIYLTPETIIAPGNGVSMHDVTSLAVQDTDGDGHPEIYWKELNDTEVFYAEHEGAWGDFSRAAYPGGRQTLATDIHPGGVVAAMDAPFRRAVYRASILAIPNRQGTTPESVFAFEPLSDSPQFLLANDAPADLALGDYDRDGDLDLAVLGEALTVYTQTDGGYTPVVLPAPAPRRIGSLAWGDLNNDGYLDLAVTSNAMSGAFLNVYRYNANSGTFVLHAELGRFSGNVAWTDYDGDGDQDLLFAGVSDEQPERLDGLLVFENTEATLALRESASLTGFSVDWRGNVDVADYDQDGDPDVVIAGVRDPGPEGIILARNEGGRYVADEAATASLGNANLTRGPARFGDYDADGWPDLLISGSHIVNNTVSQLTDVFRNRGGARFEAQNTSMTPVSTGSVAWGDIDSDGYLDALAAGRDASNNAVAFLYTYNPSQNTFASSPDFLLGPLSDVSRVSFGVGDLDNDQRLDIVYPHLAEPFRYNRMSTQNQVPEPPVLTSAQWQGASTTLTWAPPATTDATPTSGLTYNLRVGTTPGGMEIIAPNALATGYHQLPLTGNMGSRTSFTLDLPAGTYYWSVQSIDNHFAGSAFPTEGTFTIASAFAEMANLEPGVTQSSIDFTDYNRDGDYDLLATGSSGVGSNLTLVSALWDNQRSESGTPFAFVNNENANALPGVWYSGSRWFDANNDNIPELLLMGAIERGTGDAPRLAAHTDLYEIASDGTPTAQAAGFPQTHFGDAYTFDFDLDGDDDVVFTGLENGAQTWQFFRNLYAEQGGGFERLTSDVLGGEFASKLLSTSITRTVGNREVEDVFILTSVQDAGLAAFRYNPCADPYVFANDPDFVSYPCDAFAAGPLFVETPLALNLPEGAFTQLMGWENVVGDALPDLLVNGFFGTDRPPFTRLYEMALINETITFTEVTTPTGLPGVYQGVFTTADFNNDGLTDVFLSGNTALQDDPGSLDAVADIYLNTGVLDTEVPLFRPVGSGITPVTFGSVALADLDGDTYLDLALSGTTNNHVRRANPARPSLKVYRNEINATGTADVAGKTGAHASASSPNTPRNLRATVEGNTLLLEWQPTHSLSFTTYNVMVGTSLGAGNVVSPLSDPNDGHRYVPRTGNAGVTPSFRLVDIEPGQTYYWAVQAIDNAYGASPFARSSITIPGASGQVEDVKPVASLPLIYPEAEFTVDIEVGAPDQPIADLYAISFRLHMDPKVFTVVTSKAGPVFDTEDHLAFFEHDPAGAYVAGALSLKGPTGTVDGFGTVAQITLRADSALPNGETTFSLSHLSGLTRSGDVIAFDGADLIVPTAEIVIWPGDTNDDGTVNSDDILPIGAFLNSQGPRRPDAGIQWRAYPGRTWAERPHTFADANGDGRIDEKDIFAVGLNFGSTRTGEGSAVQQHTLVAALPVAAHAIGQSFAVPLDLSGLWEHSDVAGVAAQLRLPEGVRFKAIEGAKQDASAFAFDHYDEAQRTLNVARMRAQADHNGRLVLQLEATDNLAEDANIRVERLTVGTARGITRSASAQEVETLALQRHTVDTQTEQPLHFDLAPAYPNPFNPSTQLSYTVAPTQHVRLAVYDVTGREVAVLVDRIEASGQYQRTFDASHLSSGVYFVRMTTTDFQRTQRLILQK